jgi:hypothetical protein
MDKLLINIIIIRKLTESLSVNNNVLIARVELFKVDKLTLNDMPTHPVIVPKLLINAGNRS